MHVVSEDWGWLIKLLDYLKLIEKHKTYRTKRDPRTILNCMGCDTNIADLDFACVRCLECRVKEQRRQSRECHARKRKATKPWYTKECINCKQTFSTQKKCLKKCCDAKPTKLCAICKEQPVQITTRECKYCELCRAKKLLLKIKSMGMRKKRHSRECKRSPNFYKDIVCSSCGKACKRYASTKICFDCAALSNLRKTRFLQSKRANFLGRSVYDKQLHGRLRVCKLKVKVTKSPTQSLQQLIDLLRDNVSRYNISQIVLSPGLTNLYRHRSDQDPIFNKHPLLNNCDYSYISIATNYQTGYLGNIQFPVNFKYGKKIKSEDIQVPLYSANMPYDVLVVPKHTFIFSLVLDRMWEGGRLTTPPESIQEVINHAIKTLYYNTQPTTPNIMVVGEQAGVYLTTSQLITKNNPPPKLTFIEIEQDYLGEYENGIYVYCDTRLPLDMVVVSCCPEPKLSVNGLV